MISASFVFTLLFLQVSGSFFDEFRGAMSDLQHGFGKLISDVFTDVKDTVHCTISTVEQVLVENGILNKRSTYNDRCKVTKKPKVGTFDVLENSQSKAFNSKVYKESIGHRTHSAKRISLELEDSIKTFNETVREVLNNNNELEILSDSFKHETNRLNEISTILRRELDNMSNNVKNEINFNELTTVESIWGEIKDLNNIQRNSQNPSEVQDIQRIVDRIANKMQIKTNNQPILDDDKLEEIRKELHKYSSYEENNQSNVGTQQGLLMKQHNDSTLTAKKDVDNNMKSADLNTHNKLDNTLRKDSLQTEKSIFSIDMGSVDFVTPFSSKEPINKSSTLKNAKQIIEDSQHTDKVLNDFFKEQENSVDVFSDSGKFDFGKR